MNQSKNKCAQVLKDSDADTNVEELLKKNEKLAEAVKKLKAFIKSSNEDFEKKGEEIKNKEEEIERLEGENKKLKEKLWASKLKIKDFLQKLYEKDAEAAEKDDKIEELEKKIKECKNGSTDMDVDNSEAFVEKDSDDDLEILATPPKQFEEVTLDEDDDAADDNAEDVGKEKSSELSKVATPSPSRGKSCNEQRENGEIPNVSSSGEIVTESRLSGGGIGKKSLAENISKTGAENISSIGNKSVAENISKTGAENISGVGNKSVAENISKREKVVRGIQEALAIRQKSDEFPKKSTKELLSIGKKIEKCLFRQFEDVGKKYLAKYRSIVQNIRNPQNQVLFRRILQSKISARELVAMNTSDYAQVTF